MASQPSDVPHFYARPGSTMPFSQAVRAGNWLIVSGQIGIREDGTLPSTLAEQATLAMDHLRDALALGGATFADVVKCTVMLNDMSRWAEFNAVYQRYFEPGRLPARSAFGAEGLALGAALEIECTAYLPR